MPLKVEGSVARKEAAVLSERNCEEGTSEHSTERKTAADGGQMPWTEEEIGHILESFSSPASLFLALSQ